MHEPQPDGGRPCGRTAGPPRTSTASPACRPRTAITGRRCSGPPGACGLRAYLRECFDEETRPAEVWFGEPQVDGDTASVEYWAVTYPKDGPFTVSGCTVLRFDDEGLVTEARDYSHAKEGRVLPPTDLFG
ncbi:hypothetical protein NKG94_43850 [Micromonospora sp. M12]